MKHIESIQPEYAADDMTALLLSDATASAALTALLHNVTGCAIPPTADTPESEVEELVPLCLSILRRHWTTPLTALGDGTTPMSLADLLRQTIGDRVQGNEAWSIPAIHANIPTAVSALTKRHIDDGLTLTLTDGTDGSTPTTTSLPDGLSLAQLLGSVANEVTELTDSNHGWTYSNNFLSQFPNAKKVSLGCKTATVNIVNNNSVIEELNIPELETVPTANGSNLFNALTALKFFYAPKLKAIYSGQSKNLSGLTKCEWIDMPEMTSMWNGYDSITMSNCPVLKWINIPKFDTMQNVTQQAYMCNNPELERVVMGKFVQFQIRENRNDAIFYNCPKLVHLEIGQGTAVSLRLTGWSPTTALSERLPEFLSNFKAYIANRLTDNGSGLTLTLSQAVRDAIQQDPDIVNIITSKGWTISPAPSV